MADRTIAELRDGEWGIIKGFEDNSIALKLLEMGFLPGTRVRMNFHAPLGDPVSVRVSGYDVSLRLDEASLIDLQ